MRHVKKSVASHPFKEALIWVVMGVILIAAMFGNLHFSTVHTSLRFAIGIFIFLLLVGLGSLTQKGKKFWGFAKEAQVELKKVVWPTRKETVQTCLMILGIIIIATLILWGVDSLFSLLVSAILI